MFHVLIVQGPVGGGCEKYQKVPNRRASCMCNFEASARPINIVLQKGHTPCYLLEVDISRNLKGPVANENTSSQNRHPTDESHTLARVKRGKIRTNFLHECVDFATPGSGTRQC